MLPSNISKHGSLHFNYKKIIQRNSYIHSKNSELRKWEANILDIMIKILNAKADHCIPFQIDSGELSNAFWSGYISLEHAKSTKPEAFGDANMPGK